MMEFKVDMADFPVQDIKGECISWKQLCRSDLTRRKCTQRRTKLIIMENQNIR